MNLAEVMLRADPRAAAVSGVEGNRSYEQLGIEALRLTAKLIDLGLVPGDRVGVVMPNSIAHITVYYAVTAGGFVDVSLNPRSTVAELEAAFRLTRPKIVFASVVQAAGVREAVERLPEPPVVISDADGLKPMLGKTPATVQPREPGDPASILFTSGSTGAPKGVVLTHGNVTWAARAQASRMPSGGAIMLSAPLHHCYGQNAVLNAAVAAGAAVVLLDPRRAKNLIDDLARYGVTGIPTVPALFRVLLDLGADRERLPDARYAVSAAAQLPAAVADEWRRRFGFALHEGYGLTETSPCALYNDPRTSAAGSLGQPFEGVATRVVDDQGTDVPMGNTGELLIAGPNVMLGYFDDPEATSAAIIDGWLYTGDQARVDEAGDYWLAGRKKNIIIVSGANVYPSEVESVLETHPAVAAAVVVGTGHGLRGESVVAFATLRDAADSAVITAELRELCRTSLTAYKRPAVIRILDSLPVLTSGKPDLQRLRELAGQSVATRKGTTTNAD